MEHKSQDWHRADIKSALGKKRYYAQRAFAFSGVISRLFTQCIYPQLASGGADHRAGA